MKVIIEETTDEDYPKPSKQRKKKGDISLAPLWEDEKMIFPDDLETPTCAWWNNPPRNPRRRKNS